jgi:hypothetical protein
VFLLFVVLTFLGESFAGSGLFMLPLVEEASLVEAFVDLFLFADDRQDDETKQDDSKGRKTNKQSHVDVDVTITNKNKSTKVPPKKLLPLKVI